MSELYMMVTVSDRNQSRRFLSFYKDFGISVVMTTMGKGTAASEILSSIGLEAAEKALQFCFVTGETWTKVKQALEKQMKIDVPGSGIAFIIPMASIGGKKTLNFLVAGHHFEPEEESTLKETTHELLIVVANQGYTEQIMDAARSAGATGGTVIHAKGTGMEKAEKFLGVSLAVEKEMVFIVTKKEKKNPIMQAIMDQVGLNSKAGAMVCSVPVTSTAGMRLMEDA